VIQHERVCIALLALAAAAMPIGASAQTTPADPPAGTAPSYSSADETIRGRISSFDGAYNLELRDERGFIDTVQLRQGTVINPTGLRLVPGMSVTIHGVTRGNAFAANEIDTPYDSYGAIPVYPYGYAYPYPVYPYPAYGYSPYPRFSIGFRFGGGRRW
jgi:hypothetical protein